MKVNECTAVQDLATQDQVLMMVLSFQSGAIKLLNKTNITRACYSKSAFLYFKVHRKIGGSFTHS